MSATTDDLEIVKMTAGSYQEKILEARQEGYVDGYESGHNDGYEAARAEAYCGACGD